MQTFLPFADFHETAGALDRQRLGKQRSEVYQILRALAGETKGWVNHPVTRAWRGFEKALVSYGCAICDEWTRRGYRDSTRAKILAYDSGGLVLMPSFVNDPKVHAAYRGLLVRKHPGHYRDELGWTDDSCDRIDYGLLIS